MVKYSINILLGINHLHFLMSCAWEQALICIVYIPCYHIKQDLHVRKFLRGALLFGYINKTKVSTKIRKKKKRAIHPAQQHIQEIPYIQGRWRFHIFLLSNDLINAASWRPTSFTMCCVAETPSLVSTDYPKSRDELRQTLNHCGSVG